MTPTRSFHAHTTTTAPPTGSTESQVPRGNGLAAQSVYRASIAYVTFAHVLLLTLHQQHIRRHQQWLHPYVLLWGLRVYSLRAAGLKLET